MTAENSGLDRNTYIPVGKITKPHGIKGEVRIYPYSGNPADFASYSEIMIAQDNGGHFSFKVLKSSVHGKVAIVKLAGINDRTSAEGCSGLEVWIGKEYLPKLAPDEFFWHDMVGLKVFSESKRELGKVRELFSTGGHDVLVVRGTGREYLIPAKKEFMLEVDQDGGTLIVAEIPSLFDMNK